MNFTQDDLVGHIIGCARFAAELDKNTSAHSIPNFKYFSTLCTVLALVATRGLGLMLADAYKTVKNKWILICVRQK